MDIIELLHQGISRNASDLHISVDSPPTYRIDGDLVADNVPPLTAETILKMLNALMNDRQRKEFETSLETDFSFEADGRFRVNAYHEDGCPTIALRILPSVIPTLDELNMPPIVKELTDLPNGLVLVTGPTGSGKTTTLAAMINYINQNQPVHIITIEDPVEFSHPNLKALIHQRELYRDTLSFNAALRSALREDPDVILVGELRDLETIRLAITAAETGHLVFATVHTASAAKTINRLVDVFPGDEKAVVRGLLSESLKAVISQTLVKKISGGRCAAFELMRSTPAIANLIREDKPAQIYTTIQTGKDQGMQTLDQHLKELIRKQVVAADTVNYLLS